MLSVDYRRLVSICFLCCLVRYEKTCRNSLPFLPPLLSSHHFHFLQISHYCSKKKCIHEFIDIRIYVYIHTYLLRTVLMLLWERYEEIGHLQNKVREKGAFYSDRDMHWNIPFLTSKALTVCWNILYVKTRAMNGRMA